MNAVQTISLERSLTIIPIQSVAKPLSSKVAALDFRRLRHKYTATSEAEMSEQEWDFAEQEYRRFLDLKVLYPGVSMVPSKVVDKIWHAHILDTKSYREDCQAVFGKFIDHFPYFGIYGKEDYANLQSAFSNTISLYEKHYSQYPSGSPLDSAARCGGHACHVPSECACRVPDACK
ncbi:MAG: hypothetical protein RPS47_02675 [Colwellia sp.]|jgi:Uncharacterized conserved protein